MPMSWTVFPQTASPGRQLDQVELTRFWHRKALAKVLGSGQTQLLGHPTQSLPESPMRNGQMDLFKSLPHPWGSEIHHYLQVHAQLLKAKTIKLAIKSDLQFRPRPQNA